MLLPPVPRIVAALAALASVALAGTEGTESSGACLVAAASLAALAPDLSGKGTKAKLHWSDVVYVLALFPGGGALATGEDTIAVRVAVGVAAGSTCVAALVAPHY